MNDADDYKNLERAHVEAGAHMMQKSPRTDELIACLEGEIAKRDARIMGLESQYQRDVWGLNNEGDPIGGEPAGGYANDNARLRAELAALKAQEPVAWPEGGSDAVEGAALGAFDSLGQPEHDLESWCAGYAEAVYAHAAPVPEAKEQCVAMPDGWIPLTIEHEPGYPEDVAFGPKRMMDRLKKWLDRYFEMRLNAAPAAPAADAGLEVRAYEDSGGALYTAKLLEIMEVDSFGCEPLCRLSDATAIIDGLRGENERIRLNIAEYNEAISCYQSERDQQDQRIGELEAELARITGLWELELGRAQKAEAGLFSAALSAGKDSDQ